MLRTLLLAALLSASATIASPAFAAAPPVPSPVQVANAPWTRDAVLYQINVRQFTPQGTFRAAQAELPRLKALGVDILWLMPIHPIGKVNRKGTLGSPYAAADFRAVNPEFGAPADLKVFIAAAHAQGLKVILDFAANHSAWDNPLVAEHPDWYLRDWQGRFRPTEWRDYSDIIEFDYDRPELRAWMTETLVGWVRDYDVDGYRMDLAGFVPTDFWNDLRPRLDAIKPVFLLAEWQERELHYRAFDASYAWSWWDSMRNIGQGRADVGALHGYYSDAARPWPHAAMRMLFTENHDKNAWEDTAYEAFGPLLPAALALQFTSTGIPLVHNGQEACNTRRLKFFERDPIAWRECADGALIRELIAFRKANPALANGHWGARMTKVDNSAETQVLSFVRRQDGNRVFAVFNLSPKPVRVTFPTALQAGRYREFRGSDVTIAAGETMALAPGQFRLFSGQ